MGDGRGVRSIVVRGRDTSSGGVRISTQGEGASGGGNVGTVGAKLEGGTAEEKEKNGNKGKRF